MMMRKYILFISLILSGAVFSCDLSSSIPPVNVDFVLMSDGEIYSEDGITVSVSTSNNSVSYEAETEAGVASFSLLPGLYTVSASFKTDDYIYNLNASVTIASGDDGRMELELMKVKPKALIIKELYIGGCQKDDGSGAYNYDKYVILYNNSDTDVDAGDVGFAFVTPANSNASNRWLKDGQLLYDSEGWIPAGWNIWWFETEVVIPPYSHIVVAINGAIDHTATYSQSVDLSRPEYYAMYDPEAFGDKYSQNMYPNPSDNIEPSHYLQTFLYGKGNAWPVSNTSPAFYILEYSDIEEYTKNDVNYDRTESAELPVVKVDRSWVLDGIEVFRGGYESRNSKRFTSDIDAGYIYHTSDRGYTLYRNVDKEATEALPENEGRLVYGYAGGTDGTDHAYGSTDPSGIDAEASIANGAHIVYMETNNSSADFHQRRISSLKD